jgi:3-phosphoglycerate kinase
MAINYLKNLTKKELAGKTCLLRLNLDVKDPTKESLRISASLPTIEFLLERGAKILILSHRGRPNGIDKNLSLEPLINILLGKSRNGVISWLENLRFDPREQKNDDDFAKELAAKGDFYVNDDFATSHRSAASLVAITKYLPSYAGLLLEKEINNLSRVMNNPEKPLVMIIGGSKIDDKINMINNFQDKADYFLMGSAYSDFRLQISDFGESGNKIIFPEDYIEDDDKKLDIGPKTIEKFSKIIFQATTIIWNGPVGMFENPTYLAGSEKIAYAIIKSKAFSVVGGGDTGQLLSQLGLDDKFSFISTGGGAMLEFLGGKTLPALVALENINYKL